MISVFNSWVLRDPFCGSPGSDLRSGRRRVRVNKRECLQDQGQRPSVTNPMTSNHQSEVQRRARFKWQRLRIPVVETTMGSTRTWISLRGLSIYHNVQNIALLGHYSPTYQRFYIPDGTKILDQRWNCSLYQKPNDKVAQRSCPLIQTASRLRNNQTRDL